MGLKLSVRDFQAKRSLTCERTKLGPQIIVVKSPKVSIPLVVMIQIEICRLQFVDFYLKFTQRSSVNTKQSVKEIASCNPD